MNAAKKAYEAALDSKEEARIALSAAASKKGISLALNHTLALRACPEEAAVFEAAIEASTAARNEYYKD